MAASSGGKKEPKSSKKTAGRAGSKRAAKGRSARTGASASQKMGRTKKASAVKAGSRGTRKVTSRRFHAREKERLDRLVDGFGNNRVAAMLDVSQSQPSRWRSGEEKLGPESKRRVIDLDYVLSRLLQLYQREQAEIWLTSFNAHLGGRPLDVLRLRGAVPVIEAIDAEVEGAFA